MNKVDLDWQTVSLIRLLLRYDLGLICLLKSYLFKYLGYSKDVQVFFLYQSITERATYCDLVVNFFLNFS